VRVQRRYDEAQDKRWRVAGRRRTGTGPIRRRTAAAVATATLLLATTSAGVQPLGSTPYAGVVTTYPHADITSPNGITQGPDGALWFTMRSVSKIGRMTTEGALTTYSHASISGPRHITTGPDGALWFTNADDNSIGRITTTGTVTSYAAGDGITPFDIVTGPDGNLWFTAMGNNRIGRITPAGAVSTFTHATIDTPMGITSGPDGALWFTNNGSATLGRITTAGAVSELHGGGIAGATSITTGPDGALWYTNSATDTIGRMTTGGDSQTFGHVDLFLPTRITSGPDGALWFTVFGNNTIGRITTAGTITIFPGGPGQIFDPVGITPGPDANLWFTNLNSAKSIGRITSGVAVGKLRVTTAPALPAIISVNGIERDAWGLNWAEFPPGDHEVCFGPVPGFTAPPCQTVAVTAGTTTTVTGTYQARGQLRVITDPPVPATVFVEGIGRNDWGMWTDVEPGSWSVCMLAPVADHAFPPSVSTNNGGPTIPGCVNATVVAGQTTTVTATYQPEPGAPGPAGSFGYLRATTSPAVAASISVDGHWRDTWGLTWLKMLAGSHEVCFGPALHHRAPACQTVEITAGATTEVVGGYQSDGFLRVLTSPPLPATVFVDGHAANAWGVWAPTPAGSREVCFGPVPGYESPPCQQAQVSSSGTTVVTGTYVPT
jgi:virginiamycin B lyase